MPNVRCNWSLSSARSQARRARPGLLEARIAAVASRVRRARLWASRVTCDVSPTFANPALTASSRTWRISARRGRLMSQAEIVKLRPDADPKKMRDAALVLDHATLHYRDDRMERGYQYEGWTREKVRKLHAKLETEIERRGIPHVGPLGQWKKAVEGGPLTPPGFAVVQPSGNVRGPEIKLADVLKHLKPFKLRAPFMWIVGGLAVHGKTEGDIDILVRAKKGELSKELWSVIEFRTLRALPPELAERVQFHFDDREGPFTDNVPLFDLEAVDAEGKGRVVRMDALPELDELVKAVKPGRFFKPMKPALAAVEYERLTLDTLKAQLVKRGEWPVLVQKKLDGLSTILWKDGARVGAFSDDGKNLSNSLALAPVLLALKKQSDKTLVLIGEIEAWRGKMHLPRDVLTGIVHSKTGTPPSVRISATVHDCLHTDADKNLFDSGTAERYAVVRKLGLKAPLFVVPSVQVDSADAAVKAAKRMGALPGSEGAITKPADLPYRPGTEGAGWFKWRHNVVATAVVVEPAETKVKGVFNYHFGFLPDGDVPPRLERKVGGRRVIYSGKTFSTDRKFKAGDRIAIEATTVNRYDDGEVTLWLPRVLDNKYRAGKAQTAAQIVAAARGARHVLIERVRKQPLEAVTVEKGWVEGELMIHDWLEREGDLEQLDYWTAMDTASEEPDADETEKAAADPFMQYPDENKIWRYVVQAHWRGKSIHHDLRLEVEKGKTLIGWTLNTQVAGVVKEPVADQTAARKWERKGGHSKINFRTGIWAQRRRDGKLINAEIVSERKAKEPFAWLTFAGKVKPGTVGATKEHAGVFIIVDKGQYETGAQKPWLHEYFFHGKGLNGRYIFRQLGREAFQRMLAEKQFVLAPAEGGAFKEEAAWFFIKPLDQTPYVLSSRAVKDKWLPPKDVSALPKALRTKVPKELRYWETTGAEALARRVELRKLWLKEDIIKAAENSVPFVLQHHQFRKRGRKPIRVGPTAQHYDIRFDFGELTLRHWVLPLSPLENDELVGWFKRDRWKGAMTASGEYEPGHPMNPTKETRAFVQELDKGKAKVFIDNMDGGVLKIQFGGKRLKGMWLFSKRNGEWSIRKVEAAPSKS